MTDRKLFAKLLSLLFIPAVAFFLVNASASDTTATVTRLKGHVRVKYGKSEFKQLKIGSAVKVGAVISTGKKSRLELKLADNSVIRLGSHSTMTLKQAMFSGEGNKKVSARLWRGKAYAVVKKLVGKESSFQVRTSTAVAGVRGTAFRIDAKRDKSTVVRVYTGAVAVSNAPIYAKAGKPKTSSGKFQMPRQGVKPGGPGRVEVSGPKEISKKEWEEMVASAMQEIRVSSTGKLSAPVAFDPQKELENDEEGWVAWNKEMDKNIKK